MGHIVKSQYSSVILQRAFKLENATFFLYRQPGEDSKLALQENNNFWSCSQTVVLINRHHAIFVRIRVIKAVVCFDVVILLLSFCIKMLLLLASSVQFKVIWKANIVEFLDYYSYVVHTEYIYIYFFINWTLRMSDNLPERAQILGYAHIFCITVRDNRIICCQIFCDLLLKSAFERILMNIGTLRCVPLTHANLCLRIWSRHHAIFVRIRVIKAVVCFDVVILLVLINVSLLSTWIYVDRDKCL
jgi:hypothetical protein